MEFENVKDALKGLIEFAESDEHYLASLDGKKVPVSQEDILEQVREYAYNIADLLGMEELYLINAHTIHD